MTERSELVQAKRGRCNRARLRMAPRSGGGTLALTVAHPHAHLHGEIGPFERCSLG